MSVLCAAVINHRSASFTSTQVISVRRVSGATRSRRLSAPFNSVDTCAKATVGFKKRTDCSTICSALLRKIVRCVAVSSTEN